jgi:hypothetical protein
LTQGVQNYLQEVVVRPALAADARSGGVAIPAWLRIGVQLPLLRDLPTRFIALGVRRPHVRTPARVPVGDAAPVAVA